MKIYTKTGDKGETSLAVGGRVKKYDPRVELYGTTDELNSILGLAISFSPPGASWIGTIHTIQSLLFELGSELAGYKKKDNQGVELNAIHPEDLVFLESQMDEWTTELAPLKNFLLPGGSHCASFFHQARTVCRRLERALVKEKDIGKTPGEISEIAIVFANRLSDFLFVAARYANHWESISEPIWKSRTNGKSSEKNLTP